ncbi:MAG TPA: hypothetical protein DCM38_06790 [Gammaproteobacteria bacterium]|nr:hypothetical protein [Gammaproteobacteria bacterium]
MKVKIHYPFSPQYEKALLDAYALVRKDHYYPKYKGGGTGRIKATANGGSWWNAFFQFAGDTTRWDLETKDQSFDSDSVLVTMILDCKKICWLRCSGNFLEYEFDHQTHEVWLTIESARHGIPSRAMQKFKGDILFYETKRPDLTPWQVCSGSGRWNAVL